MKLIPTIKDSRGRESRTLVFVWIAFAVLVIKFAVSGITVYGLKLPAMGALEFGGAFAAILGAWLGREWQARQNNDQGATK
jgi:hypothetical protein